MLETCLKRTQFYVCGKNQENHNLSCRWVMPQTITLYEAPIFKLYAPIEPGKTIDIRLPAFNRHPQLFSNIFNRLFILSGI